MAKRKDGGSAADNMGASRVEVDVDQIERLTGQIPPAIARHIAAGNPTALCGIDGTLFIRYERRDAQPNTRLDSRHTFVSATETAGMSAEAIAKLQNALAKQAGVEPPSQSARKTLTPVARRGILRGSNRPARKQRAKPAMVRGRSKKASNGRVR